MDRRVEYPVIKEYNLHDMEISKMIEGMFVNGGVLGLPRVWRVFLGLRYGCFHKFGDAFLGVLTKRAPTLRGLIRGVAM